jgi:hypothetical protein
VKKKFTVLLAVLAVLFASAIPASAEQPPSTQSCHFTFLNVAGWESHNGTADKWAKSPYYIKPAPGCFDVQLRGVVITPYPPATNSIQAVMQIEYVNNSNVHLSWQSAVVIHANIYNSWQILLHNVPTGQHFRIWAEVGDGSNVTGDIMY